MAKRFTDTDKWKDEWFCNLTATQKLLWFYICDECDGAGVWKVNLKLASFCIGVEVVTADLAAFEWGKRIIDLGNGRLWITGFLKFQYTTLSPKNKAHIGMMRTIVRDIGSLPLEGETKNLVQSFRDIANRPSVDSQESLDSASCEGRLTPQVKVKVKVKASSSEGGAGETKSTEQHPLAAIWNQHSVALPKIRGMSVTRKKAADSRWKENPNPSHWVEIVTRLAKSEFCNGKNDRGWKADFDFLIQPETQNKALEGKYDDRTSSSINTVPIKLEGV